MGTRPLVCQHAGELRCVPVRRPVSGWVGFLKMAIDGGQVVGSIARVRSLA
jgi:hypothetical protein